MPDYTTVQHCYVYMWTKLCPYAAEPAPALWTCSIQNSRRGGGFGIWQWRLCCASYFLGSFSRRGSGGYDRVGRMFGCALTEAGKRGAIRGFFQGWFGKKWVYGAEGGSGVISGGGDSDGRWGKGGTVALEYWVTIRYRGWLLFVVLCSLCCYCNAQCLKIVVILRNWICILIRSGTQTILLIFITDTQTDVIVFHHPFGSGVASLYLCIRCCKSPLCRYHVDYKLLVFPGRNSRGCGLW